MAWISRPSNSFGSGYGRTTTLYAPTGYRSDVSYPLLLILHNYSGSGSDIIGRLKMDNAPWFDDGCLIFSPDGRDDGAGAKYWEYWTGPSGTDFDYLVNGLIDPAIAAWNVDTSKVFVMGYSCGGFMAHELCRHYPSKFTAAFTFSASISVGESNAQLAKTVPTACWHGDADGTVNYLGDNVAAGLPGLMSGRAYVSAASVVDYHAKWNGLAGGALPGSPYDSIDLMTTTAGTETDRYRYSDSTTGTAVEHWKGNSCTHAMAFVGGTSGFYMWNWLQSNHRAVR